MIHVDMRKSFFAAVALNSSFCSWVTRSSIFARFAVGDFGLAMTITLWYSCFCHDDYSTVERRYLRNCESR